MSIEEILNLIIHIFLSFFFYLNNKQYLGPLGDVFEQIHT